MMNTSPKTLGLTLLLNLVALTPAHAQSQGDPGQTTPLFSAVDRDDDGYISEDELQQFRTERRELRQEEGRRLRNEAFAPDFTRIDTDGDSKLSREEWREMHQTRQQKQRAQSKQNMFSRFDSSGDGVITEDEFNEARRNRLSQAGQDDLDDRPSFNDLDKNNDGNLTPEEFSPRRSRGDRQDPGRP